MRTWRTAAVGLALASTATLPACVFVNGARGHEDPTQTVRSDLRNAAAFQEAYFTDNRRYSADIGDLVRLGMSLSAGVQVIPHVRNGGMAFCLDGRRAGVPPQRFDSASGSAEPGTC